MRNRPRSTLIRAALIAAFGLASASRAQITLGDVQLNYRGELGIEQWFFPQEAPSPDQPGAVTHLAGQVDLVLQPPLPLELRFNPRFSFDPDDANRRRYFEINDFYLDAFAARFELRAGWQIVSWKTVESYSPADFLNQKDYELDLFDAEKLGELAARARLVLPWDGEPVLEAYYLPYFRAARLPRKGNRYDFLAGQPLRVSNDAAAYQDSRGAWRPQGALRYKATAFETVDWSVFYFNGYDRFPGLRLDTASGELRHLYRPAQRAGATFQGALGAWLVKGELMGNRYDKALPVQDPMGGTTYRRFDPYLAYATGFEYTFYSLLFGNHDLGAILEALGDTDAGKDPGELEGFRPFQNHLFGGLRYTFNNTSDRALLVGAFLDYRQGDVIFRGEYEERLFRRFKAALRFAGLGVAGKTSQLQTFDHATRLDAELGYFF